MHEPTVGSYGVAVSYQQGTPVRLDARAQKNPWLYFTFAIRKLFYFLDDSAILKMPSSNPLRQSEATIGPHTFPKDGFQRPTASQF
jgi:hypothetical protein